MMWPTAAAVIAFAALGVHALDKKNFTAGAVLICVALYLI